MNSLDLMGASFTIRLCDVLELEKDSGNGHKIGLDSYPIFDEAYREPLNRKIIEHFFMQEIGVETISLFTRFMRRRMNEIMPYWNQIYASTRIQFDPLATYDLTTVRDETGKEISTRGTEGNTDTTGDGSSTSNASSSSGSVTSNTPQTMLSASKDYATGANRADSLSNTTASQNQNSSTKSNAYDNAEANTTGNVVSSTKGFQGSAANLLRAYRDTLLNTDMLVIDQLEDLFMGIWNTQDEMMPNFTGGGSYLPRKGMLH